MSRVLESLNPEQREAVTHIEGPLLILAGPGSGKTKVITHRIAYLLEQGIPPSHILGVTFTNKAAEEMRSRVEALLGAAAPLPWIHTFHAACARLLRAHISQLSPRYNSSFSILDEGDQHEVITQAVKELDIDSEEIHPAKCAFYIERAKDELIGPDEFKEKYARRLLREQDREQVADVYRRYQKLLETSNALDFADLLRLTVRLFQERLDLLHQYRERFRYLLIDEYQDINHAQYVFARLLAERSGNLAVVGDEDQAIFSWRGSDPAYILRFTRDFPNARVIELSRHYRWPQGDRIFKAARQLIVQNTQRVKSKHWARIQGQGEPIRLYAARDERDEAQAVAQEITHLWQVQGMDLSQIAVLYRVNTLSRVLEEALIRGGIPYEIVRGLRFYERREIKDLLAYLKFLVNPQDEISLRRALARPRRGVGEATITRLQRLAAQESCSLWEAMKRVAAPPESARKGPQAQALGEFVSLMEELRELGRSVAPVELAQAVLDRTGYLSELLRSPESEERWGNLREFLGQMREYERSGGEGLTGFLEHVALLSDVDRYSAESGRVALMTLHASKGLEFECVFVVGLEEHLLPHARSLAEDTMEEERRLLYVGMTRARRRLYLSFAHQRYLHGDLKLNGPSRFLLELPAEDMAIVEAVGE
jgi:DNA helicase-2/ATP-dependent DNA helicase PcrA